MHAAAAQVNEYTAREVVDAKIYNDSIDITIMVPCHKCFDSLITISSSNKV